MVLNLDKCIGCHTCSVTCKNVWTNRPGMEYVWFNNVETKPSTGYPKQWEDQDRWKGGWQVKNGKLQLKRGPRSWLLSCTFSKDCCRPSTNTTNPIPSVTRSCKRRLS